MALAVLEALGAVSLFVTMLLFVEAGRRLGLRRFARDGGTFAKGVAPAESAVFALLGLLVAFTFSGAASRFEARRHLIAEERNAIEASWLRTDMLPAEAQPEVRDLLRRYTDVRIATYAPGAGERGDPQKRLEAADLERVIWAKSVSALRRPDAPPGAAQVVLPALNAMFAVTTTRAVATENHPPGAIFGLLATLCVVGALLFGYGAAPNAERSWLHKLTFAGIMGCTVFVIVDIEYPRSGWIRIDEADHVLIELRNRMN